MDRFLAVLGLGVTLVAAFAPLQWPGMPDWLTGAGVFIGAGLIGLATGLYLGERRATQTPQTRWTSLKLRFHGDHRIPTEVVKQNVDSWYALWTESRRIDFTNDAGQIVQTVSIPKQWMIFVQLEKPAAFNEVIVSFGVSNPPMYEVKTVHPRYIIVFVSEDIPSTVVEIYTKVN